MNHGSFQNMNPGMLFEGTEMLELYQQNPDPLFPARWVGESSGEIPAFHGRIPLSSWLGVPFPLPSFPVSFMGSPVTDLFPAVANNGPAASDLVKAMEHAAAADRSWVVIVKDLPVGHFLEPGLRDRGFVPINHDPIWYRAVPDSLDDLLRTLSKGRRRGLEGRIRKFKRDVRVRTAELGDIDFIGHCYEKIWSRAGMRLEKLTTGFFSAAIRHPACRLLVFEQGNLPFAFQMLWQKDGVLFDKYIGSDDLISREYSFYSMSMLHVLEEAAARGIAWYVAGQGSGKDKAGLGFEMIRVNLWIKPLVLRWIAPHLLGRFSRMHVSRIYTKPEKRIA